MMGGELPNKNSFALTAITMWISGKYFTPESDNALSKTTKEKVLGKWKLSLLFLAILLSAMSFKTYHDDKWSSKFTSTIVHRNVTYRPKTFYAASPPLQARDDAQLTMIDVAGPLPNLGSPITSQELIQNYAFENSYGNPYVVSYNPPSTDFNNVRLTLNITSYGRQYDRLGRIYLQNTEIWRTSTAEPNGQHISFGYVKDVTKYLSLFKSSGQLTFDMGNIVDSTYTGPFIVSLTADFFNVATTPSNNGTMAEIISQNTDPANRIIGLPTSLYWTGPNDQMSRQVPILPRDTTRIVVSVGASGNGGEEFWYTHLLDSYGNNRGTGNSGPSRFIEVYVDNQLSGVVSPYPVIYTGGFSPSIWAPIVGFKAFDVPIYEVDLTPFLPLFWSKSTTVSLRVSNGQQEYDAYSIDQSWFVSASLLVWQTNGVRGDGALVPSTSDNRAFKFVTPAESDVTSDSDIIEVVKNDYNIFIRSNLVYSRVQGGAADNESVSVAWKQTAHYANLQNNTNNGDGQYVALTTGHSNSLSVNGYSVIDSQQSTMTSLLINNLLDSSTNVTSVSIIRAFLESDMYRKVQCFQNGSSEAMTRGNLEISGNSTNTVSFQQLSFSDGSLYDRNMAADYLNILSDSSTTSNVGSGYTSAMNGNEQFLSLADNAINQLAASGYLNGATTNDFTSDTPSDGTSSSADFR